MQIQIDYYAFNITLGSRFAELSRSWSINETAYHYFETRYSRELAQAIVPSGEHWTPTKSFVGGARAVAWEEDFRRIAYRKHDNRLMFDLPGRACAALAESRVLSKLLSETHKDCTRIDVAADIITDMRPSVALRYMNMKKRLSRTTIDSQTGETEYVGSMKSDRFLRVYRYNKPHPRADKLRFEWCYRNERGKVVAKQASTGDLQGIVAAERERLSINVPGFKLDDVLAANLSVSSRAARDEAGTVIWLHNAVAPALARVFQSGALDWETFAKWVFDKMEEGEVQ